MTGLVSDLGRRPQRRAGRLPGVLRPPGGHHPLQQERDAPAGAPGAPLAQGGGRARGALRHVPQPQGQAADAPDPRAGHPGAGSRLQGLQGRRRESVNTGKKRPCARCPVIRTPR